MYTLVYLWYVTSLNSKGKTRKKRWENLNQNDNNKARKETEKEKQGK